MHNRLNSQKVLMGPQISLVKHKQPSCDLCQFYEAQRNISQLNGNNVAHIYICYSVVIEFYHVAQRNISQLKGNTLRTYIYAIFCYLRILTFHRALLQSA